jgi:hypothetical protein
MAMQPGKPQVPERRLTQELAERASLNLLPAPLQETLLPQVSTRPKHRQALNQLQEMTPVWQPELALEWPSEPSPIHA